MAEITLRPEYKQHLAYDALKEKDVIFYGGGAGGGKSWWLCESRLINCYLYPGYKSFIGREELKRLMQSTYITWQKVCKWHNIPKADWKLNGQYNYIEFVDGIAKGSRIDLLDLKLLPSDPLYERFGSLEYTDGAIEEAGEVNFLAYDVLKSRVGRHLNKEYNINPTLAITGNPKKNWTYKEFYKKWRDKTLPENMEFIQSLYSDNSYTAVEYKKQLASITDKATKQRLMYGNWEYDDDPSTLINYEAIVDLFTNTVDDSEFYYITADIARFGKDRIVICLWKGMRSIKILIYNSQGLDKTTDIIRDLARENKVAYSRIIVDEDGIGGGVVDNLQGIKGFVNNSSPLSNPGTNNNVNPSNIGKDYDKQKNFENYRNLKSQCYFLLAEAINDHEMAVDCEDIKLREELTEELEQVKQRDSEKEGKLEVLRKDEVKELIGRSPDLSDTLMMRMYFKLDRTSKTKTNKFLSKPKSFE